MKNNIFFKCFYILAGIILLFNTISDLGDSLFYSIEELPQGQKQAEFLSPQGDKKIEVYLIKNNLGVAVRAQYINLDTKAHKNIYWQTDTEIMQVDWVNNSIVNIN
ncbi:MAG: hypothetical protein IKK24_04300, partial [Clostridia bacterium]|nr:hypothetical protein [Clostridia bacterium]